MASPSSSSSLRVLRAGSKLLGGKATRAPRLAEQLYTQIYKLITAAVPLVESMMSQSQRMLMMTGF